MALHNLHIGDCVTFRDRAYFVRGMSPMGAVLRRVQLEDEDTGEHIEPSVDDVQWKERSGVVYQSEADRRRIAIATGRIVPFRPRTAKG